MPLQLADPTRDFEIEATEVGIRFYDWAESACVIADRRVGDKLIVAPLVAGEKRRSFRMDGARTVFVLGSRVEFPTAVREEIAAHATQVAWASPKELE